MIQVIRHSAVTDTHHWTENNDTGQVWKLWAGPRWFSCDDDELKETRVTVHGEGHGCRIYLPLTWEVT